MHNKIPLFLFLISIIISACGGAKALYQKGKYDKVISNLDSKAQRGKLQGDDKEILSKSIEAWAKSKAESLNASMDSDDYKVWKKSLKSLDDIHSRQSQFKNYRQLRQADLPYVDVPAYSREFNGLLFDYYHTGFDKQFERFHQTGDKNEVIDAYTLLSNMKKYTDNRGYIDSLEQICLDLGHRYFRVSIENNTFGNQFTFNTNFQNRISLFNSQWNTYDNSLNPAKVDYDIIVTLTNIDTDFSENSRRQSYSRQIEDGYRTETDTSGNTTQIPIYRTATAEVRETEYRFAAQTRAYLEIFDVQNNRRVVSENVRDEKYDSETFAYLESGEEAAVPSNVRLDRQPGAFGPDYDYDDLVEDSLEDLADRVEDYIEDF